jgi:ABC-2 type transport system ATP-binding protein
MTQPVVETNDLTLYYGSQRGIEALNLAIEPGEIFGFLGPNGAGKSTTLRVLLDVIRPNRGRATIFGLDCQKDGVAIRQRVGYLPGELNLPDGLTANQYLDLLTGARGAGHGRVYRDTLCQRLSLDPTRKMRDYSRGNKQKVGLVAAFMHQPDLLILDEPTGGLDPLVQQTVLELVREAKDEGRTVFFSSHILPEVQTVCDRVGIIRDGTLVATERVENLTQQQFRRLKLVWESLPPAGAFTAVEGITELERHPQTNSILFEVRQNMGQLITLAATYGLTDLETLPVTLEEVFLAYYGNHKNGKHNGGGSHA